MKSEWYQVQFLNRILRFRKLYIFTILTLISSLAYCQKRRERHLIGNYEYQEYSQIIDSLYFHSFLELKRDRTFIWQKQNNPDSSNTLVTGKWKVTNDTLRLSSNTENEYCPPDWDYHFHDFRLVGWHYPTETIDALVDGEKQDTYYKYELQRQGIHLIKAVNQVPGTYGCKIYNKENSIHPIEYSIELDKDYSFKWKKFINYRITDSAEGIWKMVNDTLHIFPEVSKEFKLSGKKNICPTKMILINQTDWAGWNCLYPITAQNQVNWFYFYQTPFVVKKKE